MKKLCEDTMQLPPAKYYCSQYELTSSDPKNSTFPFNPCHNNWNTIHWRCAFACHNSTRQCEGTLPVKTIILERMMKLRHGYKYYDD